MTGNSSDLNILNPKRDACLNQGVYFLFKNRPVHKKQFCGDPQSCLPYFINWATPHLHLRIIVRFRFTRTASSIRTQNICRRISRMSVKKRKCIRGKNKLALRRHFFVHAILPVQTSRVTNPQSKKHHYLRIHVWEWANILQITPSSRVFRCLPLDITMLSLQIITSLVSWVA